MARSHLNLPVAPLRWPPSRPRKLRQFRRSQPPRDGEVSLEYARPPSDGEVEFESARGPHCAGPPSRLRKWRQFHRPQPPRDGEVRFESARGVTVLGPPAGLECGD
eukprot:3569084-Pyramimonas_sp.AAC.1